jgi:hypothetical protein
MMDTRVMGIGLDAVSKALASLRLPRGAFLEDLRVAEAREEAASIVIGFEAMLRNECGEAWELRAKTRSGLVELVAEASGGKARITARWVAPRGAARDKALAETLAESIGERLRRLLEATAAMLCPGSNAAAEEAGEKPEAICMDGGEGLIRLLDLLVDEYGPEKGLEKFDDYLARPGKTVVAGIEVYPSEDQLCFKPLPRGEK